MLNIQGKWSGVSCFCTERASWRRKQNLSLFLCDPAYGGVLDCRAMASFRARKARKECYVLLANKHTRESKVGATKQQSHSGSKMDGGPVFFSQSLSGAKSRTPRFQHTKQDLSRNAKERPHGKKSRQEWPERNGFFLDFDLVAGTKYSTVQVRSHQKQRPLIGKPKTSIAASRSRGTREWNRKPWSRKYSSNLVRTTE